MRRALVPNNELVPRPAQRTRINLSDGPAYLSRPPRLAVGKIHVLTTELTAARTVLEVLQTQNMKTSKELADLRAAQEREKEAAAEREAAASAAGAPTPREKLVARYSDLKAEVVTTKTQVEALERENERLQKQWADIAAQHSDCGSRVATAESAKSKLEETVTHIQPARSAPYLISSPLLALAGAVSAQDNGEAGGRYTYSGLGVRAVAIGGQNAGAGTRTVSA
jgi:hypothetical protein